MGDCNVKHSCADSLLLRILTATSTASLAFAGHAQAQSAAAAPAMAATSTSAASATDASQAGAGQGLEEIVVTASGKDKSELNSSISVTSVKAELIEQFHPSSEGDLFRMIPGIQVAGTAGPGGNSNIAVRGLPVATGGSPFVQIQEDGLPTVLFGDIQFGNNDYWTHYDSSVERIEAVRGGSATTFASQAPGAVINYISYTGKQEGGFVQLSKGIGYDENKVDFRYGGRINDTTYYHVGGYYQTGRGALHADYNVSNSAQIKANITKELDDGKGYDRFLFKFADTQEPNYTGSPALATKNGNTISGISPYPGFDGRSTSDYSIYNQSMLVLQPDGSLSRVALNGITTKATAIQNQFHYDFNDFVTVDNNARWTKMSGGFASNFFNLAPTSSVIGSTVNGGIVAAIKYANGPFAGQAYTNPYLNNNVNIYTDMRDVGSTANDFTLTGKYNTDYGKLTARGGWFYMDQKIAMDWHPNQVFSEVNGNNPALLNEYNAAGNALSANGIAGFNTNWGNCCARNYDLSYADSAPYVSLDFDMKRFDVDASIRRDSVTASGWTIAGGPVTNIVVNGVSVQSELPNGAEEDLKYTKSYNSWTAGGLFKATDDTSVFVRASQGGRFNGDRQTVSGKINPDGSLNSAGQTAAVDFVNQYELGVKNRGTMPFIGGHYTAELTLLDGDFKQSTYELTATKCPGGKGGCIIDAKYKSYGAEFYGTYFTGPFSFVANATYSHAQKQPSGSNGWVQADGIPDLIYTLAANYQYLHWGSVGLTATGQTSEIDGAGNSYPGNTEIGLDLKFTPVDRLELGLNVYNLFDTFDLRGNGGISTGSSGPIVIGGAPALGRTITASVRFKF
jgi:outer membrane receptor protein involved in Fe transport